MKAIRGAVIAALALAVLVTAVSASGPVGVYGIVERVVFEPNATSPERVQVWGVFVYVDGCAANQAWATAAPVECGVRPRAGADAAGGTSPAERGYLYFRTPDTALGPSTPADVDLVRREWRDLAAVAGTGQAVAFGRWGFIGNFAALNPQARADRLPYLYERAPQGGTFTDLRIRPATETPAFPATYQTNAGVVKLNAQGSHARVVELLKARLQP